MTRPPDAAVAGYYMRLARDPRAEIPAMRAEADQLAALAASRDEIEHLIELARINGEIAPPDDPSVLCCSWCGSADSMPEQEEGFGGEAYCIWLDSESCTERRSAEMPPRPVPEVLLTLAGAAASAELELTAMRQAAEAFAAGTGRMTDEIMLAALPALSAPARTPPPVRPRPGPAIRPSRQPERPARPRQPDLWSHTLRSPGQRQHLISARAQPRASATSATSATHRPINRA